LNAEQSRAKVAKALKLCDLITVRDARSAELLTELGLRDIKVTCDPVMALGSEHSVDPDLEKELSSLLAGVGADERGKPLLMVAIRHWSDNKHIAPVAQLLDNLIRRDFDVLLVPAHYSEDMPAANELISHMSEVPYCLDRTLTAPEFIALAACADMVFSMRLHGLICAMAAGTPILALSYDPKVDAFMDQAGQSRYCLSLDDFDAVEAENLISELENLSIESLRERNELRRSLHAMAWQTAELATRLMDDKDFHS